MLKMKNKNYSGRKESITTFSYADLEVVRENY